MESQEWRRECDSAMCQPEASNHGRLKRVWRSDLLGIEYVGTGLTGQARW